MRSRQREGEINSFSTIITLVNQKALLVAATLRSRLFNALEWAKMAEKVNKRYTCSCYNFYLSLFRFYF